MSKILDTFRRNRRLRVATSAGTSVAVAAVLSGLLIAHVGPNTSSSPADFAVTCTTNVQGYCTVPHNFNGVVPTLTVTVAGPTAGQPVLPTDAAITNTQANQFTARVLTTGGTPYAGIVTLDVAVYAAQLVGSIEDTDLGVGATGYVLYNGKNLLPSGWVAQDGAGSDGYTVTQSPSYSYTLYFTGEQARVYGIRSPHGGVSTVSLDNGPAIQVSNYASTTLDSLLYSTSWLADQAHTLRVTLLSQPGIGGGFQMSFDRAIIYNLVGWSSGTVSTSPGGTAPTVGTTSTRSPVPSPTLTHSPTPRPSTTSPTPSPSVSPTGGGGGGSGGLTVDSSSPAVAGWFGNGCTSAGNAVTASFTAPANALLLALADTASDPSGSNGPSIADSAGLSWTQIGTTGASGTKDEAIAWWAKTPSATARTVTLHASNNVCTKSLKVLVVTGANLTTPIGTTNIGPATTTAAVLSQSVSATAAGTMAFASVADWNAAGTPTPGSGTTLAGSYAQFDATGFALYKTAASTAAAQAMTISTSAPSSARNSWVMFEVLPAGVTGGGGGGEPPPPPPGPLDATNNIDGCPNTPDASGSPANNTFSGHTYNGNNQTIGNTSTNFTVGSNTCIENYNIAGSFNLAGGATNIIIVNNKFTNWPASGNLRAINNLLNGGSNITINYNSFNAVSGVGGAWTVTFGDGAINGATNAVTGAMTGLSMTHNWWTGNNNLDSIQLNCNICNYLDISYNRFTNIQSFSVEFLEVVHHEKFLHNYADYPGSIGTRGGYQFSISHANASLDYTTRFNDATSDLDIGYNIQIGNAAEENRTPGPNLPGACFEVRGTGATLHDNYCKFYTSLCDFSNTNSPPYANQPWYYSNNVVIGNGRGQRDCWVEGSSGGYIQPGYPNIAPTPIVATQFYSESGSYPPMPVWTYANGAQW